MSSASFLTKFLMEWSNTSSLTPLKSTFNEPFVVTEWTQWSIVKIQDGLRDNYGVKVIERSIEHTITIDISLVHENWHFSMVLSSSL